ncbi:MAG: YdcF family protein [Alphaproteobacteria bacterium]
MLKKLTLIILFFFPILWGVGYFMFLSNMQKSNTPTPDRVDAIIVLTGGHNRITAGLSLFAEEYAPTLFISGVHQSVKQDDILSMWNGGNPLPECCITLGYDAQTTLGNAQEVKAWVRTQKINSIILVTNDYHMDRAKLEFSSVMPQIKIQPYPVLSNIDLQDKTFLKNSLSEYNKLLFRTVILTLVQQG